MLCNRTYKAMDSSQPSHGTVYLYEALCDASNARAVTADQGGPPVGSRECFRDNRWSSAFELIRDGVIAGYVKYRFRGGDVALLRLVLDPRFDDFEVESSLARHVLLELRRRRLAATSFCPEVGAFVADHPGFDTLAPLSHGYHDNQHDLMGQRGTVPDSLHV